MRFRPLSGMLCVLVFITPGVSALEDARPLVRLAMQRRLDQNPVWLRLLHYGADASRSEVLSDEFFLTPRGVTDPGAEGQASRH